MRSVSFGKTAVVLFRTAKRLRSKLSQLQKLKTKGALKVSGSSWPGALQMEAQSWHCLSANPSEAFLQRSLSGRTYGF